MFYLPPLTWTDRSITVSLFGVGPSNKTNKPWQNSTNLHDEYQAENIEKYNLILALEVTRRSVEAMMKSIRKRAICKHFVLRVSRCRKESGSWAWISSKFSDAVEVFRFLAAHMTAAFVLDGLHLAVPGKTGGQFEGRTQVSKSW
jgi:hypothetical protein